RTPDAPAEIRLVLAQVLLDRDDRTGAAAALARVESALREGSAPPELWLALAQSYGRAEICSAAERTVARARGQPGAKEIAAECMRMRRLAALPRDAQADLVRALELDDGTYEPWVSLASVDESLGEMAALEELKARYRKRFGAELRPALWPSAWEAAR